MIPPENIGFRSLSASSVARRGKKRAARGCERPKSREETPKEGGGNAMQSRYRAAAICHRAAQKASADSARPPKAAALRRNGHSPVGAATHCPSAVADPRSLRYFGAGAGKLSMTAVDFGSFVEQLAAKSGEVILPF